VSMAFGINVTMLIAGLCYLTLIPAARVLLTQPIPLGRSRIKQMEFGTRPPRRPDRAKKRLP